MRSTPGTRGTITEEVRRAQIVECAVEAIADLGYAAASIRKIAERVGVAMSVVLYHFGNKDDLVAAIVDRAYRTLLTSMVPAVEAQTGAAAKVRAYIREYMVYMGANRTQHQALAAIASNYRTRDGLRFDELRLDPAVEAELAKVDLETLLSGGARGREFGGLPARSVAIAVRGALDGAVSVIMCDPDFDAAGYGEDMVTMFDRMTRRSR
jgi:AcrR family transcriptional regulator